MPKPRAHVLRASPADWTPIDGLPAPFAGRVLELRDHLPLQKLGANLERIPAGARTCPVHYHLLEEEVFVVLEGTLEVREIVGDTACCYPLRAGEAVVYPPGTGIAHGFSNPGPDEAVVLSLSDEHWGEVCVYPESGKTMLRPLGRVGVFGEGAVDPAAWTGAERAFPTAHVDGLDRPAHVVPDGPMRDLGGPWGRPISAAGGARRVLVNRDRLPPATVSAPLHWHSGDEELILVLAGSPTLRQQRGTHPAPNPRGTPAPTFDGEVEEVPLQPGDVLFFGPHVPVAHQLLNRSDDDVELLVVGLDDPGDVTVFPDVGEVFVKLLGQRGPFAATGYWDGEA